MATTIQAFDNQDFGMIRTINDGGRVLFCGKDVATALGYKDPTNALKLRCKGWQNTTPLKLPVERSSSASSPRATSIG